MTYTEQIIQKAIEGGYIVPSLKANPHVEPEGRLFLIKTWANYGTFAFDPLFWQALGKSLGWEPVCKNDGKANLIYWPMWCLAGWIYHWHRFIDHRAEEKDVESFFKSLLGK